MMSILPAATIDEAWLATFDAVNKEPRGQAVNVVTTVSRPVAMDLSDVSSDSSWHNTLDRLVSAAIPDSQPIVSVAETIFPDSIYSVQGPSWFPEMELDEREDLEGRAQNLFAEYLRLLPLISKSRLNRDRWQGTYFGRMIAWKGNNQLEYWIGALRQKRTKNTQNFKAANIAVANEGDLGIGGQIHGSADRKHMGGPCLVHIDLTLFGGELHILATYRHWYLQERALGNLVGLANLLRFLAHQTGYLPGEIVVVSGVANAQHDTGKSMALAIAKNLRAEAGL